MGEIAEMMLDGSMCECCGEWLEGDGEGFPRYCSEACAQGRGVFQDDENTLAEDNRQCFECGKILKSVAGCLQHLRDKHDIH